MSYKKILFVFLILVFVGSLVLNIQLAFMLWQKNEEIAKLQVDKNILAFRNMFTEKVLLAEKEVDFDSRMSLETAVRSLADKEIFDLWQEFVKSQTKEQATAGAKKLLSLLIQKTLK